MIKVINYEDHDDTPINFEEYEYYEIINVETVEDEKGLFFRVWYMEDGE